MTMLPTGQTRLRLRSESACDAPGHHAVGEKERYTQGARSVAAGNHSASARGRHPNAPEHRVVPGSRQQLSS